MTTIDFLGLKYHLLTKNETIDTINKFIGSGARGFLRGDLNVATVCRAQNDLNFKETVNSATLINLDGMGAIFGAWLLNLRTPERIAGADLFEDLLHLAAENAYSVFFLGATDKILEKTIEKALEAFPTLRIAGHQNGYFGSNEGLVIDLIARTKPHMVFIGMPSPLKEQLAIKIRDQTKVNFIMGVGGTFDVYSGKLKRAPRWMQRIGFEWFFRLLQEPGRMWKRYLISNSHFAWLLFREKIRRYL